MLPPKLFADPLVAAPNLSSAIGGYINFKWLTTGVHYGVRGVAYCEITSLHRVVYDSDEGHRWDDVNLNPGGLDWHYAVDPYIAAQNIFLTHPTALLGCIVRISNEDDASVSFSRTALVQQYCTASNSSCIKQRVPCRMNLSALRFVVFDVRTAMTEVRYFTHTTVTIIC